MKLNSVCETAPKSLLRDLTCVPGFEYTPKYWPVKKDIVDMPINMQGKLKHTSSYSSSPLASQNKDLSTASPRLNYVSDTGHSHLKFGFKIMRLYQPCPQGFLTL